jgi:hypothetical protein
MRDWKSVAPGQSRLAVHQHIGKPDASFLEKGWEGWDHPGIVGAWVLRVSYGENDTVERADLKFDWGPGYLFWRRG